MSRNCFLVLIFLFLCGSLSAQQPVNQSALITLERNPGFFGQIGTASCPFYKLTIFDDGKVEVEPKKYGKEKIETGKIIESQITREQLKEIVLEFEKIDFRTSKSTFENKENNREECPQYSFDASTVFISMTVDGKTKQVEHYKGCSGTEKLSKLTDLENKIDEIVNIKQWFDCYRGENRIKLSI